MHSYGSWVGLVSLLTLQRGITSDISKSERGAGVQLVVLVAVCFIYKLKRSESLLRCSCVNLNFISLSGFAREAAECDLT